MQASCENTVFSVENYNKVNNYIPALDRIISEFKSRFAENDSVVLCALANILTNENPDDEAFKEVAKFYTMDEDTIKSEHKMFNHMKKTLTDTKSVSSMFKQLAACRQIRNQAETLSSSRVIIFSFPLHLNFLLKFYV